MSKLLCFVHLFDHFACVSVESKKLFTQAVDESRKCPSISGSFNIGNVAIKVISVNCFIAGKATSIRQSFHAWTQLKAFNLCSKVFALASGFSRQLFQTNTKEGASCSGGKVGDALGFLENTGNGYRHVLGRLNGSSRWVNHFPVFPQSDFLAVGADLHKVFNRFVKLKKVCWISGYALIIIASANDKGFSPFEQLRDHLTFKNTRDATVGTGENIQ